MKVQVTCAAIFTTLLACGANDEGDVNAKVGLSIGSRTTTGLRLNEAESSVTIGEDIVLTYAKFNIAKIKLKASKDQSTEEIEREEKEAEVEAESVESLEQITEADASTSLEDSFEAAPNNKSEQTKKEKREAAIKGKREELKAQGEEKLKDEAASDPSTKFTGPYIFDAIRGELDTEDLTADMPEGSYRRIEFQLKRNFSAADEEAILGNVFAIRGTVMKDGTAVPFEIDWHVALNFRLVGEGAFQATIGEDNKLMIDLNLAKWFEGIDLNQATTDADGTIYINKTSNHDIMKALHRNIKTSAGFGKDKDGNGKISDDERAGYGEDTTDADAS